MLNLAARAVSACRLHSTFEVNELKRTDTLRTSSGFTGWASTRSSMASIARCAA